MEIKEEFKAGYKKTKLGWVPEYWNEVTLGEYGETFSGLSGKSKEDFGEGSNYIPYMNIFSNAIIDVSYFDKVRIANGERQNSVKHGDVFFTTSSETPEEVGMCSVYLGDETELYLNSFCFGYRLKDKTEIHPKYISHFFRSQLGRKIMNRLAQGATRFNLSKGNLLKEKFDIPPLPEQQKIASVLSDWDKSIEKTQALIDKLQLRKKGLIQQLLNGKTRLTGFSDDWEEVRFGDLITERREYPTEPLQLFSLTIESGITPKTERYERSFLLKSTKDAYKTMHKDDFALNPMNLRFGAIGKHKGSEKVSVSKYYNIFYFNEETNSTFMEYYLTCYNMIQYYNRMAIGTLEEKKRVHYSDFVNFKKRLPSLKEQNAIVEVLTIAENEIVQQQKYLKLRQSQKLGLMQKLLTGEIRVKV